jgi:succinate-semialdehyde dehydrogenase / glutarate-semialdehyde dehydrogenase
MRRRRSSRFLHKITCSIHPLADPTSTHGPLIHERALEKVALHVEDAVSHGAQVLVGGKRLGDKGSFFLPTVLSDVPTTALVSREETFGPLAALTRFETEEEVIELANASDVGLAGYLYSRDVGRVWRVAEKLEVGMVPIPPYRFGCYSIRRYQGERDRSVFGCRRR